MAACRLEARRSTGSRASSLPAKPRPRRGLASRSINGSTGSPMRDPPAATGWSSRPIFSAKRRRSTTPNARATFDGLTLSHDIGHLWRALLEAYAYAIAHHVEVMNEIGYRTERFIVSDGGSTSRVWMQIVADVLQQPVQRLAGHPGSCVGAAWTAAIGVGPRLRLVGDFRLRASRRPDRAPARDRGDLSSRVSPLP